MSLDEALSEALDRNGDLEAARARSDAVAARARQASAFLFPTLALSAGGVRSDDPVAVFGTKLRQERFSQADFGVDALNRPVPVNDWTAGGGARWTILDPSAWAGRDAARMGARGSELGLERRTQATAFQTRVLYLRALAASSGVDAARTALKAARASEEVVSRRRERGFLTDADVLQARSEVAYARARLSDAQRAEEEARSRLGVQLGWPADTLPVPSDPLLEEDASASVSMQPDSESSSFDVAARPDLRALGRAVDAGDARVSQAVRARLPVLEAFGQLSTHAADLGGDRRADWTVGLQLRWPLFTGFAREGAVDEARASLRAAEAEREQGVRQARSELRQARRSVEAARRASDAAREASSAAREARRLVRRRFEEGLATTADLLQADARASAMDARAIEARAALRIAEARRDFALGASPDPS